MTELDFKAVLARSDLLFDRAALEAAIDRMAAGISERLHGQRPVFVTVLTGGLITAGMLAPRVSVDVDLDFDYAHATRYHGGTSGGELYWKARPRNDLAGRVVLFVDDILDEGHTLEALKKYALEAGAAAAYIAVLVRKDHDRCVPGIEADFIGLTVPDRYVFGFGMDYEEHGRSLFGIYAA